MLGKLNPVYLGAGTAVLLALLYVKSQGAGNLGKDLGGAAVDFVDGAVSGAVISTAQLIGIPPTDETECQKAMREGRTWDASFACPAGTFLKYVF